MSDTMKLERPLFCRRIKDVGGRVKIAPGGDSVRVKTRHSDDQQAPDLGSTSANAVRTLDDEVGTTF